MRALGTGENGSRDSNPSNIMDGVGGKEIAARVKGEEFVGENTFHSIGKKEESPSLGKIARIQDAGDDINYA